MSSEEDFRPKTCVVLCNGCIKIKPEKIAKKIDAEVIILDNCNEKFDFKREFEYIIFGCPALYHLIEHSCLSEIVDLRLIEKCFRKPEEVAIAWLKSSLVFKLPEIKAVETGYEIAYFGNNPEVISELSENAKICAITSKEVAENLYPFRTRVIVPENSKFTIEGSAGDFLITVKGTDVITGKKDKFKLKVGQVIFPGSKIKKEGIYTFEDEFRCALNALKNLGGYAKVETIRIDHDNCCTSKSGFDGCKLCLSCPSEALKEKNGRIYVEGLCQACGFCSAVCPVSAVEYNIMPSDIILKKIDAVASKGKTIAFICEDSLKELYRISRKIKKKLPEVLPIIVPCINSVSELHYLYAALNGMNILIFPCNSEHNFTCFEIANKILSAFNFDCIRIAEFDKPYKGKLKNPGKILRSLSGRNKREKVLHMINLLIDYYHPKEEEIDTEMFGIVKVNDKCTLCMTCTYFCPTGAIRREDWSLYFNHGLCIACGLCLACPENAITLEKKLNFQEVGEKVIYKDEVLKCPSCGKPHITKSMYEKLSKVSKYSILYCQECRPRVILETVYEEMMKEEDEGRNE